MPLLSWEEKFDYSLPDWQGFQEMLLHAKVVRMSLVIFEFSFFSTPKFWKNHPVDHQMWWKAERKWWQYAPDTADCAPRTTFSISHQDPRISLGTICILITRSASQLSHFTNQTHFKVTHYHMTPSLPVEPESISNCFSDFISRGSNMFVADCGVTNRGRSAIIGNFLYLNLCIIVIFQW